MAVAIDALGEEEGDAAVEEDGELSDLAPTTLALLGVPVPMQMTGKDLVSGS